MQYMPLLMSTSTSILLFFLLFLFIGVFAFIIFKYGWLYIKAVTSDAHVSILQMISMTLRNVDVRSIVEYRIMAKKAGMDIAVTSLEAHSLAGGNVNHVVRALIAARKVNIGLDFDHACAIDLAGRDVFDAVKTCINPKVIACPDPAKGYASLDAITKDGIQLKVKARVTIRTDIERLVGGATEETVIARVGEGIITTIGTFETYRKALESPDLISKLVMERKFDGDTAFQILSINIVNINVGDNIGAKLQADQSETDKRTAQADAEKRLGMAVAREQEMKVLTEENTAKILAAEAEVSKAIAQAFREGNLGIMDYYHMKNIQADTEMRVSSVSKHGIPPPIKQ
ncbi:MAG: flotillin-like protein FloA [Candidatus Brocadia sp.]|nr:flotillin-like protein FloA [Candidatus Brocadia sp.]